FERAVARLNLMQPEFVMSVGDLIEGGKKKREQYEKEWAEFDGYVKKLRMPFFYVPGNHDTANKVGDQLWRETKGRRWYHFAYRGALFLCLNSDDPDGGAGPSLGKEQVDYARAALAENKDARWTFVFIHKPIWTAANQGKRGWASVEKALAGRNYTVFCGHVHRFRKFVRQGMSHYQLATTGGGSKLRGVESGEFDQIAWVTMRKDGPIVSHLLLDCILPDDLSLPPAAEKGAKRTRLKTVPVRGTVHRAGVPLAGAQVVLKRKDGKASGDAVTEADGSFVPSTYAANDGLPPGRYEVGVTLRRPLHLPDGRTGPNLLPAKHADPAKSGLSVEVKEGAELRIELE
ncbi:MAG: metallophosphoesterase, partial [Gemmataceae bacterium]|nr:metallophosphoesterase [Gemmataceae bacterium]